MPTRGRRSCPRPPSSSITVERRLSVDKYIFLTYLCYLTYAPLYIVGPTVSYNAFAAQVLHAIAILYAANIWCNSKEKGFMDTQGWRSDWRLTEQRSHWRPT